jgi:hypothetical protein
VTEPPTHQTERSSGEDGIGTFRPITPPTACSRNHARVEPTPDQLIGGLSAIRRRSSGTRSSALSRRATLAT